MRHVPTNTHQASVFTWMLSAHSQLVESDAPLQPGKIRDSNRVTLMAALRQRQVPVVDLGIAIDTSVYIASVNTVVLV